ncbi:hypothetical protein VTO42DRAFT_6672 [Malbranchea cinnamomea]
MMLSIGWLLSSQKSLLPCNFHIYFMRARSSPQCFIQCCEDNSICCECLHLPNLDRLLPKEECSFVLCLPFSPPNHIQLTPASKRALIILRIQTFGRSELPHTALHHATRR